MAPATMTTAATSIRTLVVGYGNPLRGDDGLGPHIAAIIARQCWPGLATRIVHQLTPELAEELADTDEAIFIDACARPGDGIRVHVVRPRAVAESFTHAGDVAALLGMALTVYGRAPRAWLVSVAGSEFGFRDGLSAVARDNVAIALRIIQELACTNLG